MASPLDASGETRKERINLAYRGEEDPERRLCRAFEQFTLETASEPQAARFALLETFGVGQAAFARMDRGRELGADRARRSRERNGAWLRICLRGRHGGTRSRAERVVELLAEERDLRHLPQVA
jgi:hypothetical protein